MAAEDGCSEDTRSDVEKGCKVALFGDGHALAPLS